MTAKDTNHYTVRVARYRFALLIVAATVVVVVVVVATVAVTVVGFTAHTHISVRIVHTLSQANTTERARAHTHKLTLTHRRT